MRIEIKLVSLLAICAVGIYSSGCAGLHATTGDQMTFTGTPKAIQAYADYQNGLIRTAKESAKKPSEYFAHRGTQEKETSSRKASAVGFWQKLLE